jgi:SET domain-containing protein
MKKKKPNRKQDKYVVKNGKLCVSIAGHKGRGVFTSKHIKKDELVEVCPILELSFEEHNLMKGHTLENYPFVWNRKKKSVAILFGFGSLYNHSEKNSNLEYTKDLKNDVMLFSANRDIKKGEELLVDYGPMHEDLN